MIINLFRTVGAPIQSIELHDPGLVRVSMSRLLIGKSHHEVGLTCSCHLQNVWNAGHAPTPQTRQSAKTQVLLQGLSHFLRSARGGLTLDTCATGVKKDSDKEQDPCSTCAANPLPRGPKKAQCLQVKWHYVIITWLHLKQVKEVAASRTTEHMGGWWKKPPSLQACQRSDFVSL